MRSRTVPIWNASASTFLVSSVRTTASERFSSFPVKFATGLFVSFNSVLYGTSFVRQEAHCQACRESESGVLGMGGIHLASYQSILQLVAFGRCPCRTSGNHGRPEASRSQSAIAGLRSGPPGLPQLGRPRRSRLQALLRGSTPDLSWVRPAKRQGSAQLLEVAPQSSRQRLRMSDHLESRVSQDGLSFNRSPFHSASLYVPDSRKRQLFSIPRVLAG